MNFLDGENFSLVHFKHDPRFAALGVGDRVHTAHVARVFRQFGRAGAGRRVDKIKLDERAHLPMAVHAAFIYHTVILITSQPAAQAGLYDRIGKRQAKKRVRTTDVALIRGQNVSKRGCGERRVFEIIKSPHDPRHVDALDAGWKGNGSGHAGFQRQQSAVGGRVGQRKAKIGNANFLDDHVGTMYRVRRILHIRQVVPICIGHNKVLVVYRANAVF